MLVRRLMTNNPTTVSARDSLEVASGLMQRGKFRRVPVVEGDRLVGILTDRDIRRHLGSLGWTKVDGAMTADPMTITPQMTVEDAARLMISHKIGGLPVIDGGKVVGIVTTTDVLKAFLNIERATQALLDD